MLEDRPMKEDILTKLIDQLSRAAAALASVAYAVLTAAVFVGVVFRYVFVSPLGWTEELTRFLLVWCVMLGMAYTLQQGRHIRITTLTRNFSPKVQRVLEFACDIIAMVVLSVFVFKSYQFSAFTKDIGEVTQGTLRIPLWLSNMALPLGGGLFIIQYLAESFRVFTGVATNENQTH
jgi:C4-dicarboxylate transporter, DctQ subunit